MVFVRGVSNLLKTWCWKQNCRLYFSSTVGQVPTPGPHGIPPTSSNSSPCVADLITEVDRLLTNSMAPASWSTYENALCQFQSYQIQYGFPNVWPIPVPQICNFIAFLSLRQRSSSRITTYVSAISYFHKIKEMSDPTKNVVVSKLLEGNAKICGHLLPSFIRKANKCTSPCMCLQLRVGDVHSSFLLGMFWFPARRGVYLHE